jgi:hypothetical protein
MGDRTCYNNDNNIVLSVVETGSQTNCYSDNKTKHELITYGTPDSLTLLEWASIIRVFATVNLIKLQI